jgi:hypothetical protein
VLSRCEAFATAGLENLRGERLQTVFQATTGGNTPPPRARRLRADADMGFVERAYLLCGDSAALPTGASPHGRPTCDCRAQGISRCDHDRFYTTPRPPGATIRIATRTFSATATSNTASSPRSIRCRYRCWWRQPITPTSPRAPRAWIASSKPPPTMRSP